MRQAATEITEIITIGTFAEFQFTHLNVLVICNILELQDEPSSSFPLAPHHKY